MTPWKKYKLGQVRATEPVKAGVLPGSELPRKSCTPCRNNEGTVYIWCASMDVLSVGRGTKSVEDVLRDSLLEAECYRGVGSVMLALYGQ